jgi:acyl-CoA reductase-like NAD-dependent aldehyde dehydrogenase
MYTWARGGNDAATITEDFDIPKAAQLASMAAFLHSGQVCMGTKRIYVHESVHEDFMKHFTAIVKNFKAGEGIISPIQNKMQYEKVKSIYHDCEKQGYDFVVGSGKIEDRTGGYYVEPAVISNPPEHSRIVQEEPFGPIVPVLTYRSDDEVITRVNDSPVGLGATVYCRDEKRAWRLASSLETGSVWVNGGLKLDPVALFGAHKQSGMGGELGPLGPLGLTYYTDSRTITYWKESVKKETNGAEEIGGSGALFG